MHKDEERYKQYHDINMQIRHCPLYNHLSLGCLWCTLLQNYLLTR